MHKGFSEKVEANDTLAIKELDAYVKLRDSYREAIEKSEKSQENPEAGVFLAQLNQIDENQIQSLLGEFNEFEKANSEKDRIYHHYMSEETSEALQNFRKELLHYLAMNIVVKEHKMRYQTEQYERFVKSLNFGMLHKSKLTLEEFCQHYSYMIELLVTQSHNYVSPKIEANYDEYSEKKIRPINAMIFYYFFSAGRGNKTVAQLLLSAVRYPNAGVKRAYMRFFAQ